MPSYGLSAPKATIIEVTFKGPDCIENAEKIRKLAARLGGATFEQEFDPEYEDRKARSDVL